MADSGIRCVRIVHPENKIKLYRMLSGFFRFMGIFVCEKITGREEPDQKKDWSYEVSSASEENPENSLALKISLELEFEQAWREVAEILGSGIQEVFGRIAEIYLKNDLMRKSYAIAYFGDTGEDYIYEQMTASRDSFEAALEGLCEFERDRGQEAPGNIYIWAAKANCKRRICELHTIVWNAIASGKYGQNQEEERKKELWAKPFFRFPDLNNDICKILRKEPEFYGAHAIRGLAMELYRDEKSDSVNELKKAVCLIGKKSHASYLYYRIGRNYETFWPNLSSKAEYYKQAWNLDRNNYRAIYKLAMEEENKKRVDEAIRHWGFLIGILEPKREQPSLQPIECAYLYKSYRNLGNLYIKKGEMKKGIKELATAVSIYKNDKNGKSGFYEWMFGSEQVEKTKDVKEERWKIYKESAKKKLRIDDTYVDIIKAAAQMNWTEIYDDYSRLHRSMN